VPHKHPTGTAVASLSMPLRNEGPWATSAHASQTPCPRRKPAPLSLKLDITIKMPGQRRPVFRILPQCSFAQIRQNRYAVQWVGTWSTGRHLLDAGADLRFVQDWIGHASIRNTVIYAQLTSRRRDEEARNVFASQWVV
jgi:hypothetical protein